jgi:hypothetical protein
MGARRSRLTASPLACYGAPPMPPLPCLLGGTLAARARCSAALAVAALGAGCNAAPPGSSSAPVTLAPRFVDAALACDEAGGVYAAGTERFETTNQIFVAHSNRYGESWSPRFHYVNTSVAGERGRPHLAAGAPGEVYVLWEDTRHGKVDLFFNRSLDGGESWLEADVQVNTGVIPSLHLAAPILRCDRRGNIYVVWRDEAEGFVAFYVNSSHDRGSTWFETPVAITAVSTAEKAAPDLVCDDTGSLLLGWCELQAGVPGIYVNTSVDHGATWQWENQYLGRPLVGSRLPRPALALSPTGAAFAAWLTSAGVLFARSHDQGRSWEAAPQRLPTGGYPTQPQMHIDRFGHLYIVWQAVAADASAFFSLRTSADDGATFVETRVPRTGGWHLVAPAGFQESAFVPFRSGADAAGNFYLTWTEGDPGIRGIGFDRVSNYGALWLGLTRNLNLASHLPATPEAPLLCVGDTGHVYLLWNEGHTLTVASSPFYGDSGWSYEHF